MRANLTLQCGTCCFLNVSSSSVETVIEQYSMQQDHTQNKQCFLKTIHSFYTNKTISYFCIKKNEFQIMKKLTLNIKLCLIN